MNIILPLIDRYLAEPVFVSVHASLLVWLLFVVAKAMQHESAVEHLTAKVEAMGRQAAEPADQDLTPAPSEYPTQLVAATAEES